MNTPKRDRGESNGLALPRGPGGKVILCAECLRRGDCRLGIGDEYLIGEARTATELFCPKEYEGGPGVAHGGWTASVMDEALGHLPLLAGAMTVTAKLSVEFVRPVPIERPLILTAWRERIERNRWINAGELRLVSSSELLGRAHGEFAIRDRERHFARFREWIASADEAEPSS